MLIGANFNFKAADVGCSVFNLARTLADIEKGIYIDDGKGKILCPCAKPLLAGNKEEEDNVFIEYVSAMDGDPQQKLDMQKCFENNNGIFINKLMEQRDNFWYVHSQTNEVMLPQLGLVVQRMPSCIWGG